MRLGLRLVSTRVRSQQFGNQAGDIAKTLGVVGVALQDHFMRFFSSVHMGNLTGVNGCAGELLVCQKVVRQALYKRLGEVGDVLDPAVNGVTF